MSTSTLTPRPAAPATTGRARTASLGLLVLRLGTAALLLTHGLPKLADPASATGYAAALGVPAPDVAGWLVVLGEVGLAGLLVLGLATRVAGVLLAAMMAGIWALAHAPAGFFVDGQVNGENALLLGLAGLVMALTGPGSAALDHVLARRRRTR